MRIKSRVAHLIILVNIIIAYRRKDLLSAELSSGSVLHETSILFFPYDETNHVTKRDLVAILKFVGHLFW